MSTSRKLDLFFPLIADPPFRDERGAMSAPHVALSKKKKRTWIEWEGRSGMQEPMAYAQPFSRMRGGR